MRGIAGSSIIGPSVFNIFIDDLLILYCETVQSFQLHRGNTNLLQYAHSEWIEVERAINSDLALVDTVSGILI